MQAKQEKWDLYDQQGRKTGKTIQAGENAVRNVMHLVSGRTQAVI